MRKKEWISVKSKINETIKKSIFDLKNQNPVFLKTDKQAWLEGGKCYLWKRFSIIGQA